MLKMKELREDLERDEGVVYEIYLDHLGLPTFGIGHLIRETDPEFGLPVGTPVSRERVEQAFEGDMVWVQSDLSKLFPDYTELPAELRQVLANMLFNLGYNRLSKFRNFRQAIADRNWDKAADEMIDSRWYQQVGPRAKRLVARVRALGV